MISLREKDRSLSNSGDLHLVHARILRRLTFLIRRKWRDFRFVGASTPSRLFGIDPTVGAIRAGGGAVCLSADAASRDPCIPFSAEFARNVRSRCRRCAISAIPSIAVSARGNGRFRSQRRHCSMLGFIAIIVIRIPLPLSLSLSLGKYHILRRISITG